MALELASRGVRVNAVCPASVDTPFLRGFELPEDADLPLLMRSVSPMGGLIEPAEVAAAVAYLASSDAANVSGTTLVIDGGRERLTGIWRWSTTGRGAHQIRPVRRL